jgi:hypothetical protein
MNKQTATEKYGLKDWRNVAAIILTVLGLIVSLAEFHSSVGDALSIARSLTSLAFFIAALLFTTIVYYNQGMISIRILIVFRIILVVFNLISSFVYNGVRNPLWIIAYLTALLVGLIAFYFTLNKPDIAKPVIIGIIILSLIYTVYIIMSGDSLLTVFSPSLYQYFIIALMYWSKLANAETVKGRE